MSDGKDYTGPAALESSGSTSQGEPSVIPTAPDVPPQEPSVADSAPQPPSDPLANSNTNSPSIPEVAATTPGPATTTTPEAATIAPENRTTLLERARHFLASPQIQQQDDAGKRRFLSEKGLKAEEVDAVLREALQSQSQPAQPQPQMSQLQPQPAQSQPQAIQSQRLLPPPPTYPQPPPSNLPGLLLAAARALSWLAGGSAVLIFIYYRFLLPRILRTATARRGLLTHQRSLMKRFNTSLKSTKVSLTEDFKDLPRPDPNTEPVKWRDCHTVKAALQQAEAEKVEVGDIPTVTLLRCALEELKGREKKEGAERKKEGALPTTEDVFRVLEGRIPWLLSEEGSVREGQLWDTLSTSPLFASEVDSVQGLQRWRYVAPAVPPTPPLLSTLSSLSESMAKLPSETENRPFQRTLQTLGDFTGYLSSQVYAPFRPSGPQYGLGSSGLGPVEEDMRKEIRALKGLVLNRRSFLPSIPR
ncbi:uncharacterized protein SCHCODRAFT_02500613 [Schizophyllum commune H4-8]|uniref:uncharacterized protein n=1 Tax=Schizophyllum commune (strain H4-8 / FGSC 9210) TaxID=578458 RepID=UPI002160BCC5|nr:uncharacterized protein SCHCODRAFT_02500613 [Schizophyllum commune H4-8]KAI5893931.1 hypothetical protein SCHCODRAFT_02500613 [Schizophyllum commune H4-8]